MSHLVWPKLVQVVLLSGLIAAPITGQDPQPDPDPAPWVQVPTEPWSRFDQPTSPASAVDLQQGTEPKTEEPSTDAPTIDDEKPALPQPESRILASLSPASTWLWIHFKGWKDVLDGEADQQASEALRELARRDGALFARIKDFMEGLAGFASSHGFRREGFMELVTEETELSFFETAGKPDFLLFLPIGGKEERAEEILTGFWQAWKPADSKAQTRMWQAKSPYPYTNHVYASMEGVHMIFAGSPEAIDLGRSLAQEKGAALAFDEGFQSLFGDARSTDKAGWLQVFARPRKAARWIFGEGEKRNLTRGFITSLPAIGFESRFEKGTFKDRLYLGRGDADTGLFRLLSNDTIAPGFAQLVGKALPFSIRAHFSWKGLQDERRDNAVLNEQLAAVRALELLLANTGEGKSLSETLELLTGDLAWQAGDGEGQMPTLVLAMKDAFQCKSVLASLGTAIKSEDRDKDTDGYALALGDTTWFAYLDEDHLYLSQDRKRCLAFRVAIAMAARETMEKQTGARGLAEGRIESLTWLRRSDPKGNLGLLALAEWFDDPRFVVRRRDKSFEVETEAITGILPFALVSIDQLLGRLDLRQAEWNRDYALQLAKRLREAQKTFMLLVEKDEDEDGKGEAGSLTDLITARRVAQSQQFRPWGMDVYERSGYRFRMLLPTGTDARESKFYLLAWPARLRSQRPTCILMDGAGRSYTNEVTTDLDLEVGPDASQIFTSIPFESPLAAGWELRVIETQHETKTATKDEEKQTGSVADLDLEAALTLLDEAWKAKDTDRVRPFLEYENASIQARAAHYLGNLKDKNSVPTLAGILKKSKDQILRRSVARALSLIRDPRATATLLEGLTDPDAKVRLHAATAFIANPQPGSLDALLALVDSYPGDDAGDRSQAMLAIHDLDQPSCLQDLVAVKAGGSRFQQALVYTFQQLSPKLEEEQESRILIAALSNENKLLRKYAIQRLGTAGYNEAVMALEARLAQEGEELQPILQSTLAVLSPSEGTQKLKENFRVFLSKAKVYAKKAKTRFNALPEPQRYGVMGGGGFFLLVILFLLGRRRKRKKAAKRAQVLELLEHSDEFQAQAEALSGDDEGYDEQYAEGYADGEEGYAEGEESYVEGEESYEEEESYR